MESEIYQLVSAMLYVKEPSLCKKRTLNLQVVSQRLCGPYDTAGCQHKSLEVAHTGKEGKSIFCLPENAQGCTPCT